MDVGEALRVESVQAWRAWLAEHHGDPPEIWLVNDRKGAGCRTPAYDDVLDEAICHGWIDGLVHGRDEHTYLMRWTPRRPRGNWTEANRARARKLAAEGRLTVAGIASLPAELRAELLE